MKATILLLSALLLAQNSLAAQFKSEDHALGFSLRQQGVANVGLDYSTPTFTEDGYWRGTRAVVTLGTKKYYEIDSDDKRQDIDNSEIGIGISHIRDITPLFSAKTATVIGYSDFDRFAKDEDDEDKSLAGSHHYFLDARLGAGLQFGATTISDGEGGDLEFGVGLRWNFFRSAKVQRAGNQIIEEDYIYPYFGVNFAL